MSVFKFIIKRGSKLQFAFRKRVLIGSETMIEQLKTKKNRMEKLSSLTNVNFSQVYVLNQKLFEKCRCSRESKCEIIFLLRFLETIDSHLLLLFLSIFGKNEDFFF